MKTTESAAPIGGSWFERTRNHAKSATVKSPAAAPMTTRKRTRRWVARDALAALLAQGGFDVVGEAPDGAEALSLAAELQPDLVLLDVQLPDIDGFEVAGQLTNGNGPDIVLVSSRDSSDFGPLVARFGARGFVPNAELSGARIHELL